MDGCAIKYPFVLGEKFEFCNNDLTLCHSIFELIYL
jgi:hypothetical protein